MSIIQNASNCESAAEIFFRSSETHLRTVRVRSTLNVLSCFLTRPSSSAKRGRLLDRSGYRVHTAANGEETLDLIPRVKPKLVLKDLQMPEFGRFLERELELIGDKK